jgi:Ser/Thr protein kinase RdoA (MazF antagonist)
VLTWIDAVIAQEIVLTPRPVSDREGRLLCPISLNDAPRLIVAFEFLSGKEPDASDDLVAWFGKLGAISARLHAHSRKWTRPSAFQRKVWDFDAMLGSRPLWGDWRAGLGLRDDGRRLLQKVADELERRLNAYGQAEGRFGLVHADLRLANLLVEGDRLGVIDFDDCGFSWFFYDFAAAVSFFEHLPAVEELQAIWLEGYRTIAAVAAEDEAMLPVFVMLRRMLLTAWIASHAETETARAAGDGFARTTVEMGERFLLQGA